MPKNTDTTHDESDGEESDEKTLTARAKLAVIALWSWLKPRAMSALDEVGDQLEQARNEIAPQLRSVSLPSVSSNAAKSLLLAGVLITAAVAMPADPFGGGETTVETQDPVQGETYEAEADAPTLNGATLNSLPSSFADASADAPDPPDQVRASAGSQTMNVQTSVVDGEPAIVLEDDRTHDGRWVSIDTAWFEEQLGEVPNAAFITHETNGEYAAPLQVRGDSAAFYVREFSTNTVTFDGEVTLSGSQAGDGSQFEYDLNDTSGIDDPSITLTGVANTNTNTVSASGVSDGDTVNADIGGTVSPPDTTLVITGNQYTGQRFNPSGSGDASISVNGDAEPTGPNSGEPKITLTGKAGTGKQNIVDIDGDGTTENEQNFVGDHRLSLERPLSSEVEFTAPQNADTLTQIEPVISSVVGSDYGVTVDIRLHEGQTNYNFDDGVIIKDGWDPDFQTGPQTVNVQNTSITPGQTYTLEFKTNSASGDGEQDKLMIATDDSPTTERYTWNGDSGQSLNQSANLNIFYPTTTTDPSVDVDGDGNADASVSGTLSDGQTATRQIPELAAGSTNIDTSTSSGPQPDWTITYDAEQFTEDPGVDIDGDGTDEASHTGELGPSQTSEVTISPSLSDDTWTASSTAGPFGLSADITEETETTDPVVEVNGETTGVSGTLAEGETVSLSANASALQSGTNRVNISTNSPTSGPASLVGFEYSHGAETTTTATVDETTWSQNRNVSKTWPGDRANATATIPMNDRVVDVRNVEVRYNQTTWEPVADSDYTLNGTDLTVQLGDVASGSTTEVRATGSKVRVQDGSISVLNATTTDGPLNTTIAVDEAGSDFAIKTGGTELGNRVHYADSATWGATNDTTTIAAGGEQTLTLPNAAAGGETTVRTWPIEVAPATDSVTVTDRVGNRTSEPGITVSGDGNADVSYTYLNAKDATPYVLYSTTNEIVRDEGLASSPITLEDDNSDETLVFRVDDGTASGSGDGGGGVVSTVAGAAPMATGGGGFAWLRGDLTPAFTILAGLVGLLGTVWVSRRLDLVESSDADGALGTARDSARTLLENEIVVGAAILGGGYWLFSSGILPQQTTIILALSSVPVGMFLVLQQFGEFDLRIWGGTTILVGVLGTQQLAPELFETIADEAGIIIVVGAILLGWRALTAWRADANTPDEQTNVTFEVNDDDGGN